MVNVSFWGVFILTYFSFLYFNKTLIPLALVGYELIIALRARGARELHTQGLRLWHFAPSEFGRKNDCFAVYHKSIDSQIIKTGQDYAPSFQSKMHENFWLAQNTGLSVNWNCLFFELSISLWPLFLN